NKGQTHPSQHRQLPRQGRRRRSQSTPRERPRDRSAYALTFCDHRSCTSAVVVNGVRIDTRQSVDVKLCRSPSCLHADVVPLLAGLRDHPIQRAASPQTVGVGPGWRGPPVAPPCPSPPVVAIDEIRTIEDFIGSARLALIPARLFSAKF